MIAAACGHALCSARPRSAGRRRVSLPRRNKVCVIAHTNFVEIESLCAAHSAASHSGVCAHPRARPSRAGSSIEELDAQAKPHFDEAERNVPSVVADLTSQGNFLKLCWLIARDKMSGTL